MAATAGRLRTFDFSFDLTNQYTFWSGTIAAFFLFCSYFGTDQSQVQRFLTARSVDEARHSLLMSAYWKIPLQVLVLLLGVFVFVFYIVQSTAAAVQQRSAGTAARRDPRAAEYALLQARFDERLRGAPDVGGRAGRRTAGHRPRSNRCALMRRFARVKRSCRSCARARRRW